MTKKSSRVLELRDLSVSFGGLKAVSGFNLSVGESELWGIIGPNGAGKTTVFNLITGVYKPGSGDILLDGASLVSLPPYQIVKSGIARTFQNIRLFSELTVLENVQISYHMRIGYGLFDMLARTRRFFTVEDKTRHDARELLELLGLKGREGLKAASLPYGDQRRLEIARALATSPRILLLDEPAAGLNSREKVNLMETISRIREKFRLTIILIEHDMRLVMGISERIVVLDHGEVIAEGTPKAIQENPKVIEAYLGVA